ncbi:MAG: pyridine nucleotide-disulfide oxidoreductase [Bacteroidetes bacterium]|nr:MAG: pyridine nucleotide-disulfide oxidoreductase [Bacteroidota bacterium]
MKYDTIIIGGGPAGLTAGIYLSRAKMKVLILDTGIAGGQMVLTHEIANYPGYESISGFMLATNMQNQAKKHGCEIKTNVRIESYELEGDSKKVVLTNGDTFEARSVILSTGGRSREIGAKGENDFAGRGISYCATCDGDFFQDREIIVVGGGNSALEEAVSLTTYASKVTIVHMLDDWQAFESAIKEMEENPKIDYIMNTKITEFVGEQGLNHVVLENIKTGDKENMKIEGVFIFIGYVPNTEVFEGIVDLNKWGEIVTNEKFETSLKGVYAAGDNIHKSFRQVTTAVGDGTNAALYTLEYLNS